MEDSNGRGKEVADSSEKIEKAEKEEEERGEIWKGKERPKGR